MGGGEFEKRETQNSNCKSIRNAKLKLPINGYKEQKKL